MLRLGTRASALARMQSGLVAEAITAATGDPVELVEIVTTGDRSAAPIAGLGVGVFVSALREALAAKEIDLAVHSYKDLPTALQDGLVIAAVPVREDPRDALVARDRLGLRDLPAGARIGTGSPRRAAQLYALGRGLVVSPVRGNVDTRLRLVAEHRLDAVVVAQAAMARLGRTADVTEIIEPELMLPAPAQGALAVECRVDDHLLIDTLSILDHYQSRAAVAAERALLSGLSSGCSAPVAGLAEVVRTPDGALNVCLHGAVFSPDGRVALRLSGTGILPAHRSLPTGAAFPAAERIGRDLAAALLDAGADTVMGVQHAPHP